MICQAVSAMGGSVGSGEAELVLNSLSALGRRSMSGRSCPSFSIRKRAVRRQELAGTTGAAAQAAAGLNGCWRDHTCQTAIKTLRATADLAALPLPCRARTSV